MSAETGVHDKVRVGRLCEGQVLHLTLSGGKGNVLDAHMVRGLRGALDRYLRPETRAIVLSGDGAHFCFGASVAEHQRDQARDMLTGFHDLFRHLLELSVPTVAVVRGQCLGGGLELAAFCSFLFSAPDAVFGQPEIRLAVFPPLASLLLPWRLGGGRALDLCVSGRSIGAVEAQRLGLVNEIAEDPLALAERFLTQHLLPSSASSLRYAERAARGGLMAAMTHELPRLERLYLEELMETADANEGLAAFLSRRPAAFTHGVRS